MPISTVDYSSQQAAFYAEYGCMDAFNAALPDWNLAFKQESPGEHKSALALAQTPDVVINRISINQRVRQQGASPPGMVTFGLLSDRSPDLNWCGFDVSNSTLERFNTGADFKCRSERGFDVTTISVDEKLFSQFAELEGLSASLSGSSAYYSPDRHALNAIRLSAQQVFQQLRAGPQTTRRKAILDGLSADLAIQLLYASSLPPLGASRLMKSARLLARERATEYMHTHARSGPAIGTLCTVIGCSWRLLDYAFKEHYGVGPKTYLLMMRLDGVRGDLIAADQGETVTAIATRWGFTHFGQLGRDYKKLFGKLPSQTLQQTSFR